MPLQRVSLTGADDAVSHEALHTLSQRYPLAEWAILYFPEREGTERNPSAAWREQFLAQDLPHTAAHLCGTKVFRELLDIDTAPARIKDIARYGRVQLNINARQPDFTLQEVLQIYQTLHDAGIHLILQYHLAQQTVINWFLGKLSQESVGQVSVLMDESKGKGVTPGRWVKPLTTPEGVPLHTGYAGGLGPQNAAQAVQDITTTLKTVGNPPFWIDMESGIRTDNQFDLGKCEQVLQATA